MIFLGILVGLFLIVTVVLLSGNGLFLIHKHNLPDEAEKPLDKSETKKLSRLFGIFALIITIGLTLFWIEQNWVNTAWMMPLSIALLIGAVIFYLVIRCTNIYKSRK